MSELLQKVQGGKAPEHTHRLYKMYENLVEQTIYKLAAKYNMSMDEVRSCVFIEFIKLLNLYNEKSYMTLSTYLRNWLYLRSDNAVAAFIGKPKHRKVFEYNATKQFARENDPGFCGSIAEKISSEEGLNLHLAISDIIEYLRKNCGEVEIDIFLLSSLYGFTKKEISKIINVGPTTVKSKLKNIQNIILENF